VDEEVYAPKQYDVAGVDLIGHRQEDGSIKLGPGGGGAHLPDFPKSVRVVGVVYNLERITKNRELSNLSKDHDGYNIEWGEYM